MLYADNTYYSSIYLGTADVALFNKFILKASKIIDKNINTTITSEIFEKLSERAREELRYTACALVDLLIKKEESDNRKIASLTIDGVSKNYKTLSKEDFNNQLRECLLYLPDELTRFL